MGGKPTGVGSRIQKDQQMIILKQEPTFTLCVNGKELPGFRVVSEWEGFVKIANGPDTIILTTTKIASVFSDIFTPHLSKLCTDNAKGNEYAPIVASKGIWEKMGMAPNENTPPSEAA